MQSGIHVQVHEQDGLCARMAVARAPDYHHNGFSCRSKALTHADMWVTNTPHNLHTGPTNVDAALFVGGGGRGGEVLHKHPLLLRDNTSPPALHHLLLGPPTAL